MFTLYFYNYFCLQPRYLERLKSIRATLQESSFFRNHELIGSSLLFVHDKKRASIWMIDFAKTVPVPDNQNIDHNTTWKVDNHEDGYLIGLDNLISIFESLIKDDNSNVDKCYSDVSLDKNVRKDSFDTWSIEEKISWKLTVHTVILYCSGFAGLLHCTKLMACLCEVFLNYKQKMTFQES